MINCVFMDGGPDRPIQVNINTRTADIKRLVGTDTDLIMDGESIDRLYLCAPPGARVRIVPRNVYSAQVTVMRTTDNQPIKVTVDLTTSVLALKQMLQARTGIPTDNQRLMISGQWMDFYRPPFQTCCIWHHLVAHKSPL